MLSIGALSSSGAAVSYYEKDDYYETKGENPDAQGQWFGQGAERLGLEGAVGREDFKALLEGTLPDGTQLGTIREEGGEKEHRPGYDLTFSAPKSVTLIAELGGDKAVIEAHQKAVRQALGWIEGNVAATRVKVAGEVHREETGNLVIATFQHDTNRNHDPQLHTHAVVINATEREDGKWRSLDGKAFFESQAAGTAVYRSALALELQKLGYQLDTEGRDGKFEIAGVPAEAIAEFSTRRAEIEASLKARGLEGPEAAATAALMTRNSKQPENRGELAKDWADRAEAIGFDPQKIIDQARERGDQTPEPNSTDARKALRSAITRLSDSEAAFTHSQLVGWTLAGGMGSLSADQAEAMIYNESKAGRLHGAQIGGQRGYTTLSAVQQEERIQGALERGRGAVPAAYSPSEAATALSILPERRQAEAEAAKNGALWRGESAESVATIRVGALNEGQSQAVQMILSAEDRIVGVLGRPGTGKTFMLGEARGLLAERGLNMVGMAMNAAAARQLTDSAGIEAKTIDRHLNAIGKDAARLRSADPERAAEIRAVYAKQVWVIDEASQVNNEKMRRLTTLAEKTGARMVLVGDPDQLGAIEAGKPFARLLANGMQHREMDEIRRQADARHVDVIRDVIAKDFGGALGKLAPETREISDRDERLRAMIESWRDAGEKRDSTLLLTARNATRNELTDMARDVLRSEGKIAGEKSATQLSKVSVERADTALASTYKPGQIVNFPRALAKLGVERNTYARVVSTDPQTGSVSLDVDGQRVTWSPGSIGGGTKRSPTIYEERETKLANGERIVWTKNNPELGLENGSRLTVLSTDDKKMIVQDENGRRVEIDRTQRTQQHWEHGYATTVYKSQGQTAERVLIDANSADKNLFTQKAFLVAVSRQTQELTLYTDSADKLRGTVERNTGDKLSAVETRAAGDARVIEHANRQTQPLAPERAADKPQEKDITPQRPQTRGLDMDR